MSKLFARIAAVASFAMMSTNAFATPVGVPEIDAGSAAIAVGLVVGVVALIRERRSKG